jgi:glutathione synthase/RimK-type ligase-like ATP-grasp enzyme
MSYCEESGIAYKVVDCYRSDIIQQLYDCNALMYQFHQGDPKDILFAKQLMYSVAIAGKRVFPDFYTMWHFDDKVGQKYLLEAIDAPLVPSWVFYDKQQALDWVGKIKFPVVFKLRNGAGSGNVRLVRDRSLAVRLVNRAFGRGFSQYSAWGNVQERIRRYRLGKTSLLDVAKGIIRLGYHPRSAKVAGRERGYVYFQEFIPGNDYDIRVIVIGEKAFAIKRMVRAHDFRASGSGHILYGKEHFDDATIRLSFELARKLKSQCVAFDFVYENGKSLVVEISYGFSPEGYDSCVGYWDKNLSWHKGRFNPYGWMVDMMLENEVIVEE